jgi:hypothetical protein
MRQHGNVVCHAGCPWLTIRVAMQHQPKEQILILSRFKLGPTSSSSGRISINCWRWPTPRSLVGPSTQNPCATSPHGSRGPWTKSQSCRSGGGAPLGDSAKGCFTPEGQNLQADSTGSPAIIPSTVRTSCRLLLREKEWRVCSFCL